MAPPARALNRFRIEKKIWISLLQALDWNYESKCRFIALGTDVSPPRGRAVRGPNRRAASEVSYG